MLRITVEADPETMRIKVEGRLAGPYVAELDRTWRGIEAGLQSKRLCVDLCGMTGMDETGERLLAEIYRKSHAEFIARSVLADFYAQQARRRGRGDAKEGEMKCAARTRMN